VKFSIDRTLDTTLKGNRVSTVLTTVDRVETPDASTALVHTKKPIRCCRRGSASTAGRLSQEVRRGGRARQVQTRRRRDRPLRFVSWTKDDKIVLEAYPSYWGGRVDFDRLVVRALPEMAPRVAALPQGRGRPDHPGAADQGERVKGSAGTTVTGALYGGLYVLAVNSKRRRSTIPS